MVLCKSCSKRPIKRNLLCRGYRGRTGVETTEPTPLVWMITNNLKYEQLKLKVLYT